jgi:transmembrane 9 superfamily protein 2/4
VGGILSFGAMYVELYYIMSALWMGYNFYEFGFIIVVLFVLFLTCAEVTVLIMYFQLNREDHRWWWRSFCNAGSIGIYVFFYSIAYFQNLEAASYETYIIYFGYMGLVSFAFFCMMGFVGLSASLWFNKKIFTSIKID